MGRRHNVYPISESYSVLVLDLCANPAPMTPAVPNAAVARMEAPACSENRAEAGDVLAVVETSGKEDVFEEAAWRG